MCIRDSFRGVPSLVEPGLDPAWIARTVAVALDEDLGPAPGRDVTTQATIPRSATGVADLVAREAGTVAGLVVVPEALRQVAERLDLRVPEVAFEARDGDDVAPGQVLATVAGPAQVLLIAERTLLNLASRASGVATATRAFARALEGTGATVLDTRKTTPGLRALQKYAVRAGGGTNKRMGLYDVAMVKDNHVVAAGSVADAVKAVRTVFPEVPVQVEADTTAQAIEALSAGADFLLLDNMPTQVLAETVKAVRAREGRDGVPAHVELEATGNLTVERAREVAGTGVDHLSVGALTHSAPILDLALDLRA
ncbi:carboxylating nicotinate-nucleotide diphosphorylase [Myceligenerans indicum]|uniref:nicotinate-nucleotide diphosphorylase (carboxylating) n=1 Tax=Myceligenerans indicum TaxID=2593663 RepID=A0ABS1LPH6_9MICO|nr:carboxylating nicotinate-nucleotide diphosphorylase [Myceligenerans indicum]MBL0888187.1 carboxylating nicotinate-nucleotide diphosphorylase [Myceligenerans indicum]